MTLCIGHRGAAGSTPENTLRSFRRARELGAAGVEFDVHRTADGHLVVIHDAWLDRTTTGSGLVRDLSLEQVRAADAGVTRGEQFRGERVPTLTEVIAEYPDLLFLELKAGSIHYPGIEAELVDLLRQTGAASRTQVSSFDHHALLRIRELDPALETGLLHGCNLLDPVGAARAAGCTALHPEWYWVTPAYVARAHEAGLTVNVWTVNEPWLIEQMRRCGVDGIMTDYPERMKGGTSTGDTEPTAR
jgi:glycerophosphoryl diester phosphodiesterase